MKIVILGSGNVATHIAAALARAGHEIVQVYSRSIENAQSLADKINNVVSSVRCSATDDSVSSVSSVRCSATDRISLVTPSVDACLFAVKDDALPFLAESLGKALAEATGTSTPPVFIHTAGSVPMDVFAGHAQHYGVLYPMQTFSKNRAVDFREIPCFVEGNDSMSVDVIESLARTISGSVHPLSSEKRKSLHLAAVFACNFTNHCYRMAERVLQDAGIDFSLYLPLIDEAARKVHELSPSEAQTGPAVRYDETVINRHLAMLSDENMREIYRLMSQSIHRDSPLSSSISFRNPQESRPIPSCPISQ